MRYGYARVSTEQMMENLLGHIFIFLYANLIPILKNKKVSQQLKSRLSSFYGSVNLKNKKVYRYHFNLALNNPDLQLNRRHCHHIDGCEKIINGDYFNAATDDREDNLLLISANDHNFVHQTEGDRNFFLYAKEAPS